MRHTSKIRPTCGCGHAHRNYVYDIKRSKLFVNLIGNKDKHVIYKLIK